MSKSEAPTDGDELDLIKVYIWVMVAMTVVLGGVVWFTNSQVEETHKRIEFARKNLEPFAETKQEINAMLSVYTANKEDEAREQPLTWFSRVWGRKGIENASIRPGAWQEKFNARGGFDEDFIELKFDNKNPLTRRQIGEFCHEIERESARLRIIQLKMRRSGKKDQYDDDAWAGSVTVGYRKARIRE
jgi:hypothetical protein